MGRAATVLLSTRRSGDAWQPGAGVGHRRPARAGGSARETDPSRCRAIPTKAQFMEREAAGPTEIRFIASNTGPSFGTETGQRRTVVLNRFRKGAR